MIFAAAVFCVLAFIAAVAEQQELFELLWIAFAACTAVASIKYLRENTR